MKKILSVLLVMVLCLGVVVNAASLDSDILNKFNDKEAKLLQLIEKMHNNSKHNNKEFKITWDKEMGIPSFITGELSEEAVNDYNEAIAFLLENKDMFKLNKGEFKLNKAEKDELGMSHYKTNQLSNGIPVYGAEAIVHTDAQGNVFAVNGNVNNTVPEKAWKKMIKLNEKKAIKAAEASLGLDSNQEYEVAPTAKAYVYNNEGEWLPIYYVTLQFMEPYAANMKVFVNAVTGEIIKSRNEIQNTATTGTGTSVLGDTKTINIDNVNGTYYLRDLSKGAQILTYNANYGSSLPGTLFSDSDNVFNSSVQKAGVDAHYNVGATYDFYKNVLGRNSFDGQGATIKATVHYGSNYNNAFWNGSQMVFGDGDGNTFIPLSAALDVIAHEFTHAVTTYSANLEYENQSGALNESFSDVFGYLLDPEDWLMGEDIYTPNTPGDALRSMSDPAAYDQPAHMNDYQNLPNTQNGDWGGVHINSGIPNKAFYLAATSINNNEYMAKIYYRALTQYLSQYSNFEAGRTALEQAATDLYGAEVSQKISDAFAAVGVGSSSNPPANEDTYEPNGSTSEAYGPLTSGTTYDSYIYSASDVDYYYIDTTATGTISVTCGNLAGDYDLYLYNASGTQVAKSTNSGTTSESISYNSTATGKYYIKVYGYNGAMSTSKAYALKATYPTGTTPPPTNEDTYEPNGSTSEAYGPLTSGTTYDSYIYSASDVDYYYIDTTAAGTISVTCGNLAGDYELYLYDASGTQVARSINSGTTSESISYNSTAAGKYYIKVYGYDGAMSTTQAYALTATYPTGTTPPPTEAQWYEENATAETPHNYPNNYNKSHYYTKTGATKVALHFSRFEVENGYDFVYIKDASGTTKASYTGTKSAFWAEVDGETIYANLVSDYMVTAYGYYIDKVAYYANGQLVIENVTPQTLINIQ